MGRKIPGRKHRGVRDPEKQRAERFNKLKYKINAPPSNPDGQEVPKSVQRLADLTARAKTTNFKRKKSKEPKRPKLFEQYTGESDRSFLLRVNRHCDVVKREAAFEQKYGVEIKKNYMGEIQEVKKRGKDPVQVMIKEARRKKKSDVNKLTKSQKRRLKLVEKRKKLEESHVEEEVLRDDVKFGEVVHAPPTLVVPRRGKSGGEAPRPGRKNLLLKSMLCKTTNEVIDKTGKRKNLPVALRRQLDKHQQEVIEAYRSLKK